MTRRGVLGAWGCGVAGWPETMTGVDGGLIGAGDDIVGVVATLAPLTAAITPSAAVGIAYVVRPRAYSGREAGGEARGGAAPVVVLAPGVVGVVGVAVGGVVVVVVVVGVVGVVDDFFWSSSSSSFLLFLICWCVAGWSAISRSLMPPGEGRASGAGRAAGATRAPPPPRDAQRDGRPFSGVVSVIFRGIPLLRTGTVGATDFLRLA